MLILFIQFFSAFFAPDITCLGFNLVEADVIDNNPGVQGASHGCFFVLEEPPHEPKFGLEPVHIPTPTPLPSAWDNLSWQDFKQADPNGYLNYNNAPTFPISQQNPDSSDKTFVAPPPWSNCNSQTMASILMRRPFRLCVQAEEMLPK